MPAKIGMYCHQGKSIVQNIDDTYQEMMFVVNKAWPNHAHIWKKISPDKLTSNSVALYLVDLGGLPEVDRVQWQLTLLNAIINHPSTLFVLWSTATKNTFRDVADKWYDDVRLLNQTNIMYRCDSDTDDALAEWIRAWFAPLEDQEVIASHSAVTIKVTFPLSTSRANIQQFISDLKESVEQAGGNLNVMKDHIISDDQDDISDSV